MRRFFLLLGSLLLGMGWPLMAADPPSPAPSSEEAAAVLHMAVLPSCSAHLEKSAALLAPKLLANHLKAELETPVASVLFESEELLGHGIKSGEVQAVALLGDTLARGRNAQWALEPVLMSCGGKVDGKEEWVLLAPAGKTAAAVAAGKIIIAQGGQGDLPMMWLEKWRRAEIKGGILPEPGREPQAEVAIIRTFFGKADACLAPAPAFHQASAANLEIAQRLRPLAASPAWPGVVICLAGPEERRPRGLRQAVENLAHSPHGQALARLWKSEGWRPFETGLLPEMERLLTPASAPAASKPAAAHHPTPTRAR